MMEEVKKTDSNTKTQLSLAAALFFSPLVGNMLKKDMRDISEKDREFIQSYVKFGYITLIFGLLTIFTGIMHYTFVIKIWSIAYTISISVLIFLLIISVVSILSDIRLVRGKEIELQTYSIEGDKKDIIIKYLPIYNIYLWYHTHSFEKPNRWIKESILLWTIFLVGSITGNTVISGITLFLLILRIAALMSDMDFLNIPAKHQINKLFSKNPEEIRGYVSGFFVYLAKYIAHMFTTILPYSLAEEVAKEKEVYSRIIDIKTNKIIVWEYIVGICLIAGFAYITQIDLTVRTYYVGCGLFIARYVIMLLQLKHLPHLPIAREIILLIKYIGKQLHLIKPTTMIQE